MDGAINAAVKWTNPSEPQEWPTRFQFRFKGPTGQCQRTVTIMDGGEAWRNTTTLS